MENLRTTPAIIINMQGMIMIKRYSNAINELFDSFPKLFRTYAKHNTTKLAKIKFLIDFSINLLIIKAYSINSLIIKPLKKY